jgi:hypothetical protein
MVFVDEETRRAIVSALNQVQRNPGERNAPPS